MTDKTAAEAALEILAGAQTFFLSTTAGDEPWGAGAFFAETDLFELSVVIELHGRTLRNIRQNPRVAVVVSSGNPFEAFLQGAATVEIFEDEATITATAELLKAKAPQIAPILGAPIVALRLHVTQWRVTDIMNGWLPGKELFPTDPIAIEVDAQPLATSIG